MLFRSAEAPLTPWIEVLGVRKQCPQMRARPEVGDGGGGGGEVGEMTGTDWKNNWSLVTLPCKGCLEKVTSPSRLNPLLKTCSSPMVRYIRSLECLMFG